MAAGDRVLGPDELIELLSGSGQWSYSTDDARTEALGENAVAVLASLDSGARKTPS